MTWQKWFICTFLHSLCQMCSSIFSVKSVCLPPVSANSNWMHADWILCNSNSCCCAHKYCTDALGDKRWTHYMLGTYSPFVSWELSAAFGQLIKMIFFLCFLDSVFTYVTFTYRDCIDYSPRSSTLQSIFRFIAKA